MAKKEQIKLTKYEKARILGSRALQISMGAPYLVKFYEQQVEEVECNPSESAKLELEKGVIPIDVVRPLPNVNSKKEMK